MGISAESWWYGNVDVVKIYTSPDLTSHAAYSVSSEAKLKQLADEADGFILIEVADVTGYVSRNDVLLYVDNKEFFEDTLFNHVKFKVSGADIYFNMFTICYVLPISDMRDVKQISEWTVVNDYIVSVGDLTDAQQTECSL